jgi:hypothetical protein
MTRKRKQSLDGRSFHQLPLTLTGYEAMKRVRDREMKRYL